MVTRGESTGTFWIIIAKIEVLLRHIDNFILIDVVELSFTVELEIDYWDHARINNLRDLMVSQRAAFVEDYGVGFLIAVTFFYSPIIYLNTTFSAVKADGIRIL